MLQKTLSPEDVQDISSEYLSVGRKHDSWEITSIQIDDRLINAKIRMSSVYQSPTDSDRFHLTVFSTLEFLSQLMVIYFHVWAGLDKKTGEVWMIDSKVHCRRPIRDPQNILVSIEVKNIRKIGKKIYANIYSRTYDNDGGLFEARIKYFLS